MFNRERRFLHKQSKPSQLDRGQGQSDAIQSAAQRIHRKKDTKQVDETKEKKSIISFNGVVRFSGVAFHMDYRDWNQPQ